MRIAICTDKIEIREQLNHEMQTYLTNNAIAAETVLCSDMDRLISRKSDFYDLYLIQIEWTGTRDGIDLASAIRTRNKSSDIIFLSYNLNKVLKAFEVNAFRYLMLPLDCTRFSYYLNLAVTRYRSREMQQVLLHRGEDYIQIPISRIIMFETFENRKLKVETTRQQYFVDDRMADVEHMLAGRGFMRVHRSYLINLSYIRELQQSAAIMINDQVAYVSRRNKKSLKDRYAAYAKQLIINENEYVLGYMKENQERII